jgi:sulfur relay (sulfurtransferase) DsrF/TusC family protein
MEKIAILLTRAPYGAINAAEAVRHALGAVGDEFGVSLVLADGGALLAAAGQDVGDTGFSNLGEALGDCVSMGVSVFAEKESLARANLAQADIVEGVKVVDGPGVSQLLAEADQTIIY